MGTNEAERIRVGAVVKAGTVQVASSVTAPFLRRVALLPVILRLVSTSISK